MKRTLLPMLGMFLFFNIGSGHAQAILTNIFDGPLPGGLPKGVELYVPDAIADLSSLGIGSANNGEGTDSVEFSFPSMAVDADTYLYVTLDSAGFNDFFGFNADFLTEAMSINGDDAIELFWDGEVIDVFGDINMDGSGTAWDHLDGWASRKPGTGPDGNSFELQNWNFSGVDALDGATTNSGASVPVPLMSYTMIVEPDFVVILQNLVFSPSDLAIEVGQIVRFTNVENNVEHNVNGNKNVFPCNPVGFSSGSAAFGPWDFDVTFNEAGFYQYQCDPHISVGMIGSVTVVDPNAPEYPGRSIAEVTTENTEGVADSLNADVTLNGVVYGQNISPGALQFTIIDSEGNGIMIFEGSADCYEPVEGDLITLSGLIGQFNGLTQLNKEGPVDLLSQDNALQDPIEVVGLLGEDTESKFIVVRELTMDNITPTGSSGWNVTASNSNGTYVLRLDADVINESVVNMFGTGAAFDAYGLGGQFDNSSPYTEGYQLSPRRDMDIDFLSGVRLLEKEAISLTPNPTTDLVWITSELSLQSIAFFALDGSEVLTRQLHGKMSDFISLGDVVAGIYFVRVLSTGGIWTSKLVKF